MTYTLFLVLIMIVAFLLILIIMVQNPKGGGLSSSFGGGGTQALGGVQNTTNFLDKSTWTLSIILLALILLSNFVAPKVNVIDTSSEIENTIENREVQDVPELPAATTTLKDSAQ
ncbi:preprotein translocase subunit SecG [uncultured Lutibacter sp.]|uniref:preprotein translocase subunit SecG n=1 Tax=uncultured Lutibacter sp. TaxID=437739 RepID=UPI0026180F27|nr:preprotein translocase subunit SecG [uncultured Lutibacter sp.]